MRRKSIAGIKWLTQHSGTPKQRGIVYYGLSANAQRPLAGTLHAAFFNVARRVGGQILYVLPPMVIAYGAMQWAIERYVENI